MPWFSRELVKHRGSMDRSIKSPQLRFKLDILGRRNKQKHTGLTKGLRNSRLCGKTPSILFFPPNPFTRFCTTQVKNK